MDDYFGSGSQGGWSVPPAPPAPWGAAPGPAWWAPAPVSGSQRSTTKVTLVVGTAALLAAGLFGYRSWQVSLPPTLLGHAMLTDQASRLEAQRFEDMPTPGHRVGALYGEGGETRYSVGLAKHAMSGPEQRSRLSEAEENYSYQAGGALRFEPLAVPAWRGRVECVEWVRSEDGPGALCVFVNGQGYGVLNVRGAQPLDDAAAVVAVLATRL